MCQKIVLIPAYKPKCNFIELLKKIDNNCFKIIVVNDGSGEEYNKIFNQVKKYAYLISLDTNQGKGRAIKTGLKYIKENFQFPYVIATMDCDLQHKIDDMKKICEEAVINKNALIIGKREFSKKVPIKSKIGNLITSCIYFGISKKYLQDTQTGLRAFSNEIVDFLLSVEGERYEYEMNVLWNCFNNNIQIKEIEIETIYFERNINSNFKPIIDSIRIYKQIIKFSISSIVSFGVDYVLYSLFITVFNKINFSNILARFISSIVNYNLNRKIVFKNNQKKLKSVIQYFSLVIAILFINTILLNTFVSFMKFNAYIAKILVEVILFVLSYIVQSKIIFKKGKNNDKNI